MGTKWMAWISRQGVAEVALSGNLGFVPLDEVLRLLARAGQKGAVEIQGDGTSGRIFFTRQGIALATTREDEELRSHLINTQFVDSDQLADAESGRGTLKAVAEERPEFVELLREMTVESIYQLSHNGSTFEVDEDAATPYASPTPFELESILTDSARRANEWAEVEEILSDMAGIIRIKRDLGDRTEVTVSRDAWKLLSELGVGSSVSEMASRLGTTEFWTARVASDLTSRELLTIVSPEARQQIEATWEGAEADESYPTIVVDTTPEPEAPAEYPVEDDTRDKQEVDHTFQMEAGIDEAEAVSDDEERPEVFAAEAEVDEVTVDEVTEPFDEDLDVDPNESWWVEPDGKSAPSDDSPQVDEQRDERRGRLGMFSPSRDEDDELEPVTGDTSGDVEEDTEAFLEKVFSQLEEPAEETPQDSGSDGENDEDEAEASGHGLLRRRRLGSILTDSTKSND